MARSSDPFEPISINDLPSEKNSDLATIRQALIQLRKLATSLPKVDAVAVIRSSREIESSVD